MNTTQIVAAKVRPPLRKAEEQQVHQESPVSTPVLIVEGKEYQISKQITTLGRHIQNDVVIANQAASRFHCRVVRFNDIYILQDLGSTNGVVYQGDDITGPVQLKPDDIFYIADTQITIRF